MKNIFSMLSLQKLTCELKRITCRFPIAMIAILAISILSLLLLHGNFNQIVEGNLLRGIFSTITLFFFSVGLSIYGESIQANNLKKSMLQVGALFYSSLYFLFYQHTGLNDIEEIVFFSLSLVGIIGFLYFAPYFKNILSSQGKQSVYYTYFYNISVVFLLAFVFGIILITLGFIGITTVHTLFDLNNYFNNEIYGDWAIISASLIAPIFALTLLPTKKDFTNNYFNENSFFSFLVKYIAIPFIYIYFIILYAYSAKVLSNFGDWPKGEVSWMVIAFSIFGYITYVFSYIFQEKNKYISVFRKYFPYVVIPQIFMLFYAIYLRISQYDITINRYFVVIFGLWLLCVSIYYAVSKKKYLGHLFTSLTLFTIIISVGPWSVYSLPEARQYNRLVQNLQEANILQENGEIIPLENKNDITSDLSKNIHSGIQYLCNFENCEQIKELFPEIYNSTVERVKQEQENVIKNNSGYIYNNGLPDSWDIVKDISETIKVYSYYDNYDYDAKSYFYINLIDEVFPIDTQSIQKIYKINSYEQNSTEYNSETAIITVTDNQQVISQISINDILLDIHSKAKTQKTESLNLADLTFEISNNYGDFILILESITIHIPNADDMNLYSPSYNGYLLKK